MIRFAMPMLVLCLVVSAGCTGDKGKELLETAQFEEKQHNEEHARILYEEIVKKYPGTEFARKAEERLRAIKGK